MGNCQQPGRQADDTLSSHLASLNRSSKQQPERNPSATSKLRLIESQFKSDIGLELRVHTLLPSIEDTLIKTYSLAYKVSYGRTVGKWAEEGLTHRRHKS